MVRFVLQAIIVRLSYIGLILYPSCSDMAEHYDVRGAPQQSLSGSDRAGEIRKNPDCKLHGLNLTAETSPTYDGTVAAIMTRACTTCHSPAPTGYGQYPPLSTYAEVRASAARSVIRMKAGTMPLTGAVAADGDLFSAWIDAGYFEAVLTGDPAVDVPPPPPVEVSPKPTPDSSATCT